VPRSRQPHQVPTGGVSSGKARDICADKEGGEGEKDGTLTAISAAADPDYLTMTSDKSIDITSFAIEICSCGKLETQTREGGGEKRRRRGPE